MLDLLTWTYRCATNNNKSSCQSYPYPLYNVPPKRFCRLFLTIPLRRYKTVESIQFLEDCGRRKETLSPWKSPKNIIKQKKQIPQSLYQDNLFPFFFQWLWWILCINLDHQFKKVFLNISPNIFFFSKFSQL